MATDLKGIMEIATSMALCSSSPTPIHPSPHAVSEMDFTVRSIPTHHTVSKPIIAGLPALLASSNVRFSSSCTSDPLDTPSFPIAVVRSSYSDPCLPWDGIDNWSDSSSICSPNLVKMREQSPVSVLQGPLVCNSRRVSAVMRDRTNCFSVLEQQLESPVRTCADAQQSLVCKEILRWRRSAHNSYSDEGDCVVEEGHLGSAERQSHLEIVSALGTEAFDRSLGVVVRTAEDLLFSAQERHGIFKDPFVIKAFREAEKAHRGQFRVSGDLYLVHCVETAIILAEVGANKVVVAAGLLHDTIDDSAIDYEELQDMFGTPVADLVEGVSRLSEFSKLARDNDTASKTVEADRLHTMFLAMTDVRVVLIKLADRLHNMTTLVALPEYKQQRIAKETLGIFTPLANRLGVWSWKAEMEDLCFKHLNPQDYQELAVKLAGDFRGATITSSIHKLAKALVEEGIVHHDLCGRCKNLYGIYSKMIRKGRSLEDVYDVRGLRLIVANKEDCYTALETVHKLWQCIPGKVKDYIAQPKSNGYQSLHTIVCGDDGLPLEVQIRTTEMHHRAELGVAAHWRYKEDNVEHSAFIVQMVEWVRWMLTWQSEIMGTKLKSPSIEFDLWSPCPFPSHREGCPHSQILQTPPQSDGDPLFVIVLEDDRMMVQELPGGSTVADLLYKRVVDDSFAATCGIAFCEELRPSVNHKVVDNIQQVLKMGDLVEMTPLIPDESLVEYREKIKRMFGNTVKEEGRHAVELSSGRSA